MCDCEHLIRDDICNANLEVVCAFQNPHKYLMGDEHWNNIHSLRETFCDYPNECEYADKIVELATMIYGHQEE